MSTKRKLQLADEGIPSPKRARLQSTSESATSSLCITGLTRPNNAQKLQRRCTSLLSDPQQVATVWMNPVCSLAIISLNSVDAAKTLKVELSSKEPNLRVTFAQISARTLQSLSSIQPCAGSSFVIPDQTRRFDRFFDETPPGLLMDRDSFYLMTPKKESVEIAGWIAQLTNDKTDVVIDASAGIGGNSFAFARDNRITRVYSIEINPTRFTALVSNALAFGLDNITAIHSDFVEWMHSDEFSNLEKTNSCVFVDPPWGGPDYKNLEVIEDLYLSNADDATKTSMTDLCTELINQVPCIVLKLPFNFDIEGFKQRLNLDRAVQVETLHRGNIVFMALYK